MMHSGARVFAADSVAAACGCIAGALSPSYRQFPMRHALTSTRILRKAQRSNAMRQWPWIWRPAALDTLRSRSTTLLFHRLPRQYGDLWRVLEDGMKSAHLKTYASLELESRGIHSREWFKRNF
jgi:hypothetical protein